MARIAFEVVNKRVTGEGDAAKTYWERCGVIFVSEHDGQKRYTLKLNMIPVGSNGSFYLFPPKKKDNNYGNGNNQQTQDVVIEDIDDGPIDLSDIPF